MKIYHYTTIDSLAMIMSSRSIKFNRLDKVDDLEERTEPSQLRTPFSTTLCRTLRTRFDMISNDDMYESTFCIFEKLLAMYYYYLICKTSNFADLWPPMGSFTWNPFYMERGGNFTFKKFFEEVIDQKENSQLLKSGMFEGKFEVFDEANTKVNGYVRSRGY